MLGSTLGSPYFGKLPYITITLLKAHELSILSDSSPSYMSPKPKKREEGADLGEGVQGFAQISARRFYSCENCALPCYRNMQAVPKSHELNNGWTLMNSGTGTLWRGLYTAMKNSNAETRPYVRNHLRCMSPNNY